RRASQSRTALLSSTEAPYSMLSMILLMLIGPSACGLTMGGCIAAGDVMAELTLDIAQKRRCADAEQIGAQPVAAQFLGHQHLPVQRVLCHAQPARRLEADAMAGPVAIVADRPAHHQRYR